MGEGIEKLPKLKTFRFFLRKRVWENHCPPKSPKSPKALEALKPPEALEPLESPNS